MFTGKKNGVINGVGLEEENLFSTLKWCWVEDGLIPTPIIGPVCFYYYFIIIIIIIIIIINSDSEISDQQLTCMAKFEFINKPSLKITKKKKRNSSRHFNKINRENKWK